MPPSPQARTVALPQRWPLIVQPGNRDATQRFDAKLINGYAEKDRTTGEYQVYRRLGLSAPKYQLSGAGRGMFQWIGNASVTYGPVTPPSIPPFNCNIIAGYNPLGVYTGYISGSIGSIDNANIGAGISVVSVYDDATVGAVLGITGFSSDPGSTYIVSVTANGVTLNAPSAVYSYNAGTAFWQWNVPVMYFGFIVGLPYPVTINFANSGPQTLIYTAAPILVMIAGMTVSILTQGASPVLSTLGSIPSGGICRFCQINAAIPLLLFGDGVTGTYYTDGSTITRITDPNFPTSTVPGLAILDGTIYVMTPQGQIFGSANLDDPSTWSATNVAVASVEGDLGVYLARQLTYIIAFKQWTIQVFFDNANPSGSPLSPVYGAVINYGCLSAQTVQDLMGALYFVCNSKLGTPQVGVIDNLAFKVVSSPAVDRLLESATINTPFYSFPLHKGGHRFYVLSRLDTGVTLVYDLDQELWYFWQASSGACWPIVAQAYDLMAILCFRIRQPAPSTGLI